MSAPTPLSHAVVLRQTVHGAERAARLAKAIEILERAAQPPANPKPERSTTTPKAAA